MKIEQIYTGCLAEASYFISSETVAAVVDPIRDVDIYLERAAQERVKIKYIFETHFHADFVSGHIELANKTGATIIFGPNANPDYKAYIAKDNETFDLGKLTIQALHTPGHTFESTCFLLSAQDDKPYCLFTGDTLFIGDVGRPDLAANATFTKEDLAGLLYESIYHKILTLPEDILIYPAHGAGSVCGKKLSSCTYSTLKEQKETNYALKDLDKDTFVKQVIIGLSEPPEYFPINVQLNKIGYNNLDMVYSNSLRQLSINKFQLLIEKENAIVLDTRHQDFYMSGHIPSSLFIGLNGQFALWAGTLLTDKKRPIVLITDSGLEKEAITRLARVGVENVAGYLDGGIETWINNGKSIETIKHISADALSVLYNKKINTLDVRRKAEYEEGHLENTTLHSLEYIYTWANQLSDNLDTYVYCAGGYRSVIAISIIKQYGLHNLINIDGGFKSIKESNLFHALS